MEFFRKLFDTSDFPARWSCGEWSAGHGWLHIGSDLATFGAYTAIPIVLVYFVLRRRDAPFPKIFWAFGAFILSCGAVHLVEALIFWWPAYRLSGTIKLVTAVASWGTVAALVPLVPRALSLPGLRQVNEELRREAEDREQIQASLKRSEERYKALVSSLASIVWSTDAQGAFREPQPGWESFTGQSFEDHRGFGWVEALHPSDRESIREEWERCLRTGEPYESEGRIWSARHGGYRYFQASAVPMRDEVGRIAEWVGTVADVTDERLGDERFRLAVESSPSGMVMIDGDGTIVMANREAEDIFGYEPDELLGRSVEVLVPPRHRGEHPSHRAGYFSEPKPRLMGEGRELHGVRKDGSEVPVEIGLNPIETPEGTFVLSAVVDITERARSEEALRAKTEELERSNADLEQFAYVASHDLQEPLRMVSSFLQLLVERKGDRLDAEGHEFVDYAVDGARRMSGLIRDLLAYSRVGTRGGDPEPVDADAALEDAILNLRASIDAESAEVSHEVLPAVQADPGQIRQLFQNLVGNAIKFRRPEEPPHVHVSGLERGNLVEISVTDNGIGIDPDYSERIFGVFQRLHTRDAYEGTGIGLALCKKIVERHGGSIRVEAAPDHGTTFRFTLPRARGAPSSKRGSHVFREDDGAPHGAGV